MTTLIVPAAGKGSRLGSGGPKALTDLAGEPLINWVLRAATGIVERLVVVIQPAELPFFERWAASAPLPADVVWAFQEVPEGSLAAVRIGVESAVGSGFADDGVIVAWADQVGLSARTLRMIAEEIAGAGKTLVVPLSETPSPYVWVELSEDQHIARVKRSRDGDISPSVGLADLGVFGFSAELASLLVSLGDTAGGASLQGREIDFTYALPVLSVEADRTVLPRMVEDDQLIAINTPEDLDRARTRLGSMHD